MNVAAPTLEHPTTPTVYGGPVYEGPAARQSFSLPESLMYYVAKHPTTPELQLKMVKTCKWFYAVNPVVVCSYMHGSRLCTNDRCVGYSPYFCRVRRTNLSSIRPKIWITKALHIDHFFTKTPRTTLAAIVPKLFTTKIPEVRINTSKPVAFKDAAYVISGAKVVTLNVMVRHVDGSAAAIEEILRSLEEAEEIFINCKPGTVNHQSANKMAQLENLGKINNILLKNIPATMNTLDLFDFILEHRTAQQFYRFNANVKKEYHEQLDALVDAILAEDGLLINVKYPGQNASKERLMARRYADNLALLRNVQANV